VNIKLEDIHNLKIRPIEQNQIAADYDVRIIRRRRREHTLQIGRARLHPFLKPRGQRSVHHQLALQSRRKTIALGEAGRKIRVMIAVPAANLIAIMIVIAVMVTTVAASVATSMAPVIIVGAILVFMTVPVALGHCDGRGKRH
jgi:hypothetical protein